MSRLDFANYRLDEAGVPLCEPCVVVALFSEAVLTKKDGPDLSSPYHTFVKRFGSTVSYCRTGWGQMHATPIKSKDLAAWPDWLADPKRRSKGGFVVELRTGKSRDEWRAPSLQVRYSTVGAPKSYYRISLPLDSFSEHGTGIISSLLREMLFEYPLLSGYVGYSFVWDYSSPHVIDVCEHNFRPWLRRHPGILCPSSGSHSAVSTASLTDLGWLTLLGPKYIQQLGGFDALSKIFDGIADVSVEPIGMNSALIRIGESPVLGDTHTGDHLQTYRAVGRLLATLRDRQAILDNLVVPGIDSNKFPEERIRWIDRFFPATPE